MTEGGDDAPRSGDDGMAVGAQPLVSVVMPVHNAMPYLNEAIESVLAQSFARFELFIGDDCSEDGSAECIRAYAARDPRIRHGRAKERLGPVGSSNWVAREARMPIVARMDADDVARPDWLAQSLAVLEAHPDAALVGSLYTLTDAGGRVLRGIDLASLRAPRFAPIAHSSAVFRKAAFEAAGGYREGSDYFEDVDLYERMNRVGRILVISDTLVAVRRTATSARLCDDPAKVEVALSAVPLEGPSPPKADGEKLPPSVFYTIAVLRLWARMPSVSVGTILRRARLRPFRKSVPVLLFGALVSVAPGFTRGLSRAKMRINNWRAAPRIRAGRVYQWLPDAPAADMGPIGGEPGR